MGCFSSRTSDHGPIRIQEARKEEEKKSVPAVEPVKISNITDHSVDHSVNQSVRNPVDSNFTQTTGNSQHLKIDETSKVVDKWLNDVYTLAKVQLAV